MTTRRITRGVQLFVIPPDPLRPARDVLYPEEFARVKRILRTKHPRATERQIEHWARAALSRWRDK